MIAGKSVPQRSPEPSGFQNGRWFVDRPVNAESTPVVTVKYEPDRALRIPDTCQPPINARAAGPPMPGIS